MFIPVLLIPVFQQTFLRRCCFLHRSRDRQSPTRATLEHHRAISAKTTLKSKKQRKPQILHNKKGKMIGGHRDRRRSAAVFARLHRLLFHTQLPPTAVVRNSSQLPLCRGDPKSCTHYGRGAVNPKGIQYYNNVIDELVKHGIEPHVTLCHYDFPQIYVDEYGGWLSARMIDDFRYFADVSFKAFGDRVSHWTTMNEPNVVALYGYDYGIVPPQRCSKGFNPHGLLCKEGNSSTEPYIVVHNMILAHSAAVEVYRSKYQAIQKGSIGINLWTLWTDPLTNSMEDEMAAQRTLDFMIGWFMDPLVFGDYPKSMKQNAGLRLPSFTEAETRKVKGAFDFIGVNYYFSLFVGNNVENLGNGRRDMSGDMLAKFTAYKQKPPTDTILPPNPLPSDPRGLPKLLKYFSDTYENPILNIQENGYGIGGEDHLNDTKRISYISGFIGSTLKALRDGSDVRGYFVWSFVDLFELSSGFTLRIGLYHVNFTRQCERIPKQSALWYTSFLKNNSVIKFEEEALQLKYPATPSIMQI